MSTVKTEIDEAIAFIQRNLYDPLTLDQLASHVAYSPYHFARLFKERMGISPLYYVSSMRLQRAKDLLLRTHLSVRDISLEIGQQSLGTFTTRFTERVGMTPAHFRNSGEQANLHLESLKQLDNWQTSTFAFPQNASVRGTITTEHDFNGVILIGLFEKPIPEGFPIYGTLQSSLGEFELPNVKPGIYFLMATTISWGTGAIDMLLPQMTLRTRSRLPVIVQAYEPVPPQEVILHLPQLDDPPILISLPVLMTHFLGRVKNKEGYRK
ncbi:helix-turn-helix transcriptional regulator [Paenibacillus sp. GSMTC-2017]|uniref:helix-turn-helix transcriptional regulator n=1 Tax=Paenibacillus sp. GSMTC-2017 TaxID=2794350 RepID=UPI0018D5DCF7|nr:AraC family transcriptional regulator [Paenibacillus sp. GSMTC-2017]MBH5317684.1 helix-turn-helix transcriptional regulator [Paenibacillus sp. GSMTC-2017]